MSDIFVDPVVAEIHAIRSVMLREANNDVHDMMRHVLDHQRVSGRRIIQSPLRKRSEQTVAVERRNDAESGGPSTPAAH